MKKSGVMLGVVLLSLAGMASVQAAPLAAPTPMAKQAPTKESVQQKLVFVKMLLSKSSLIGRAAESNDPALKKQAESVMALYASANNALNSGDVVGAEKMSNEVLDIISDTSNRAPDPARIEAELRTKYNELMEGMQNLQVTFQEMPKSMNLNSAQSAMVRKNLDRLGKDIAQAQNLERQRNLKDANALLDKSYAAGVADMNQMMSGVELSYEAKFDNPADEFKHELSRFKSFEDLIPVAHEQLKPDAGKKMISDRAVQQSKAKADEAKRQAASGDHKGAIVTINDATEQMKSALKILGLTIPE